MRKTFEGADEDVLIHCSNHECASNGGSNASALQLVGVNPRSPYECYWSRRALAAEKKLDITP